MLYESSWFFCHVHNESADPLRTFRPGIWRWIPYAAPLMARVPDRDWVGGWSVRIRGRRQKMPNSWYQSCHFLVLYKKQLELDHRCMGFGGFWCFLVVVFLFRGVLGWWWGFFGQLRFFLKHVNVMNIYLRTPMVWSFSLKWKIRLFHSLAEISDCGRDLKFGREFQTIKNHQNYGSGEIFCPGREFPIWSIFKTEIIRTKIVDRIF